MSSTAALVPGHFLVTQSTSNRGANRVTHHPRCECDVNYRWETRDEDHARHLLAIAWQAGAEAVALATLPGADPLTNPWED